ncbi:MAG: phenylalanine--tRNA ligase subunit alpha [Patescibacteria group bacterium]
MNIQSLKQLEQASETEIRNAADAVALERVRLKYLGRQSGTLTKALKSLKDLPEAERKAVGPAANAFRQRFEAALSARVRELVDNNALKRIAREKIDVSAPGTRLPKGHLHPLTQLIEKAVDIFSGMGFTVAQGPEVETEFYNFDALNVPKDHPARDMQDTFWLDVPGLLLRTQTSSVQIHYMEQHKPPLRVIVPGRVFRNEATDATHETQFYQLEGLMVDEDVSLANLKAVLGVFFRLLLDDEDIRIRFRPSYFPFVEPGVEVDISCFKCNGKGCAICKRTGWIEVMGAGMVHQAVFEAVGIDPRRWRGFAFGAGLDRIAMIKYGVDDVRLFYDADMRFLKQF